MANEFFPSDPETNIQRLLTDRNHWKLINTCICDKTKEVFGVPKNSFKRKLLQAFGIKTFPAGNIKRGEVLHGEFRIEDDTLLFDFPMTTRFGIMDCTLLRNEFNLRGNV